MRKKSIGDMIVDNAMKKHTELNANSTTAWMTGFVKSGERTAKIIVASAEPITVQNAVSIVQNNTKGNMRAYAPSFVTLESAAHPNMFFASIHAYKPKLKMRIADTKAMTNCHAISATTYMDTELNSVWERTNINGTQYLIRTNEDDPQEVLTTALLANTNVNSRVQGEAFNLHANKGDFVLFFATETPADETSDFKPFLEVAEVTATNDNSVSVMLKEDEYYVDATIPTASIVQTITASSEDIALGKVLTRDEVINFLKQCYPAEYGVALDSIADSPRIGV